jgi:hypothetical protein
VTALCDFCGTNPAVSGGLCGRCESEFTYRNSKRLVDPCLIDGCSAPWFSRGLCRPHYAKHYDAGTLELFAKDPRPSQPSYMDAHSRLRRSRGSASGYECVDCGRRARDWSYQGGAPDEAPSEYGPYTYDSEFYVPRCASCHGRYDHTKVDCPRGHNTLIVGRDTQRKCRECGRERARRAYWAKRGVAA